jgi:hypothetical protein
VNDPTVFRRDCFKPNCATTLFNQRDSAVFGIIPGSSIERGLVSAGGLNL